MKTATFQDHVVIVTGASSGIGKALSLQLADEGANLSLAARNAERLDALARECQDRGGSAVAIPTDVSNEQNCQALPFLTTHPTSQASMPLQAFQIHCGWS
jgi:NADP-dependent 3-hydroxy acid dehydrogenase YdfG